MCVCVKDRERQGVRRPNIKKVVKKVFFPDIDCEYIDFTHMSVFIKPQDPVTLMHTVTHTQSESLTVFFL